MRASAQPGTGNRRPLRPAVAVLALACSVVLAACGTTGPGQLDLTAPPLDAPADPTPAPAPVPIGRPLTIDIPAIEVSTDVVEVALLPDGAMEVPEFGLAGWYGVGPRPGAPGPAVIVAHVDSKAGPDVFHRLRELEAGDRIFVRSDDGAAHAFAVTGAEQAPKDQLPTDRIWADVTEPVLRLITCGGSFDHSTGHYRDNVIVYAASLPEIA